MSSKPDFPNPRVRIQRTIAPATVYNQLVKYPLAIATIVAGVTAGAAPAHAVILLQSETRNTTAPAGALAGSGWQWQGQFNAFLGTPISSKYFVTAQHIGSIANGLLTPFFYDGTVYQTTSAVDVPGTDLRIWRIAETFNNWAPLYDRSIDGPEAGKDLVVFGRGTQRGEPIYVTSPRVPSEIGASPPVRLQLKGWKWGAVDSITSWGQNRVEEVIADESFGELLYFSFDNPGGPNEAALSGGDSGGGVFIQSPTGQWKLAGINLGVDGPFRLTETGEAFSASVFDAGGLYVNEPATLIPDTHLNISTGAYSSSVAGSLPFILSTIATPTTSNAIPEPATAGVISGLVIAGSFRRRHNG